MSCDDDGDEIDARLAALPRPKLAASAEARIHGRSRRALLASAAVPRPVPGAWMRLWTRAVEPIAVAAVVVGYLVWTANALAAIDWGRTLLR